MSKNGKDVVLEKTGNEVVVPKNVNGTNIGKMVFAGKEVDFAVKGELTIAGNVIKLQMRELVSELEKVTKWDIVVDGYSFQTYKGKDDSDNFTDMVKDGKHFLTNLGFQSIKRIAESKKWNVNKLHTEYLKAVGRISQKSSVTHKAEM